MGPEPIGVASSAVPEADTGRAIGVARVTDARSPENRQALTAAAAHRSDTVVPLAVVAEYHFTVLPIVEPYASMTHHSPLASYTS